MAKDLKVKLQLSVNDKASQPLVQASKNARKALKEVGEQAKSSAKTQQKAVETTAQKTEQANKKAQSTLKQTAQQATQSAATEKQASEQAARSYEQKVIRAQMASRRLKSAKETLDIRTEREIRAEIRQTMQAYQMLARSGTASARDLARAYERVKNKVRELNKEMGKHPAGQRLGDIGRGLMGLGAGIGVGVTLAKQPIQTTADYNLQLAYLANTAYSGQSKADKKAGMDKIHNVIKESTTKYGGSKETALEALNSVVAQGKVSVEDALELLPTIQKNAMATGATTTDIAGLVNAGLGYGIKKEEIQDFIDYANSAGKSGGFEIKDMAQYAPSLFAAASGAGLKGMDGAKEMFKMLQQVYNVSGGSSETATNTMNFLSKLNSQDTQNRASKIEYFDKKGKQREINLKATMGSYMAQGKDTVGAFLAVVDDILAGDKEYQKALKNLENAKDDAQKAEALNRVADYMMGSRVGELVADRQAWLGLYGIRSQTQTGQNVEAGYKTAIGSTNEDAEFISEQAAIKFQRASNTTEMGKIESFSSLTEWSGDMAETLANYGSKYPELTSALMGATESVKILGGAAIAAAGSMALLGGLDLGRIFSRRSPLPSSKGKITSSHTGVRGIDRVGGLAGGKWLSGASKVLGAASIASIAMEMGEHQPYEQAKSEALAEKQSEAKAQFAKGYASNSPKVMGFAYGGFPLGVNSKGVPLYGGYALAHLNQDDQVAKARYELGSYNETQYQQRLARNATMREQYTTPKTTQTGESATQALGRFALSLAETTLQQGAMQGQLDSVTTTLSQYQADFAAFGQQISDGLQAGLAAQSHTIDNRITIELDGRVIAENSSQHFFTMANRG